MRSKPTATATAAVAVALLSFAAESAENPWPRIRKERIAKLLPAAMERAGVDAWVVVCRENDNDPLAAHVGGENAGGTAAFLFFRKGGGVSSVAVSPAGEATALKEVGVVDRVVVLEGGQSVWDAAAAEIRGAAPKRIAVDSGGDPVSDGLSWTQRNALEKALGPDWTPRLTSAADLVAEWLSVKLPEEVEIMRKAAAVTSDLQVEAYRTVVPGKTRDSDLARYLKKRMLELGYEDGWAPDQNPNVNSGPDRGHSHATDKVIQPGDFIQTDFGVKVHGRWVTDIQRFAYVLAPGETAAPKAALEKWEKAKKGSRVALSAMKPGATGYDVDRAQRAWMKEAGSLPMPWGTGHPVGYWAHDPGPGLSGAQSDRPPGERALRKLVPGQTFAFDGFFCWELDPEAKTTKGISVEEMAVVTEKGAEYLNPPQEDLILVPSR